MKDRLNVLLYGDSFNERYGIGLNYPALMQHYGDVTLINPFNVRHYMIEKSDILVLPGGADIDPERYGEKPEWWTQRCNTQYEWLDKWFLPEWIKTGKPIIGICRGMQDLNVVMGGTLWQHIRGHVGNQDRRDKEHHKIYTNIQTDTADFRVYGVNSYHHQAVKRLADGFDIIGWSCALDNCPSVSKWARGKDRYIERMMWSENKNGDISANTEKNPFYYAIPEIMKHQTLPYIAFQYHPEDMNCELFHHLVGEMLIEHKLLTKPEE